MKEVQQKKDKNGKYLLLGLAPLVVATPIVAVALTTKQNNKNETALSFKQGEMMMPIEEVKEFYDDKLESALNHDLTNEVIGNNKISRQALLDELYQKYSTRFYKAKGIRKESVPFDEFAPRTTWSDFYLKFISKEDFKKPKEVRMELTKIRDWIKNAKAYNVEAINYLFVKELEYQKRYGSISTYKIPNGVTEIPDNAFKGVKFKQKFVIPKSVKKIGVHAFALTDLSNGIQIPNTIETIERGAFGAAKVGQGFKIPSGIKELGYYVYERVILPEGFTIPAGIDKIRLRSMLFVENLWESETGFSSWTDTKTGEIDYYPFSHDGSITIKEFVKN